MSFLVEYDISFISLILLVIMFFITRIKKDVFSFSSSMFTWIIFVNAAALIIEPLAGFLDGYTAHNVYVITYILNFALVLTSPILIGLWASYLDYKLFKNKQRIIRAHFYQWPTYIIFLLLVLNLRMDIFYTIDPITNLYTQGPFHLIRYALAYAVFFYLIYQIMRHHHKEDTHVLKGVILFMFFPVVGSVLQYLEPELLLIFPFLALAIVIVYIFLETTSGTLDHLTKLYSRHAIESYINLLIEQDQNFHVVMIDLDNFKSINDIYGHQVGDQVLKEFSTLLKACRACPSIFPGRLGGDEFLVVITDKDEKEIIEFLNHLKDSVKSLASAEKFNQIDFSYGITFADDKMTLDDILTNVDRKMYAAKKHKR